MNWEITTFIAYFVILLGVALVFYFNGTNKNSEDFFLGGRSMGPWVTALSAQASDMSAWLLMGLPGSILAFGFGQMWIGIGLAIGTAANWILCAKRLRTFSKAAFEAGMTLGDGLECLPAGLEILAAGETSECLVTLREGKFHQVKRMLAARGKPVTYLKRLSMGSLRLDDTLAPGEFRLLTAAEEAQLQR